MAFESHWYYEQCVICTRFHGAVTPVELDCVNQTVGYQIKNGALPVHLIIDGSAIETIPPHQYADAELASFMADPNIGAVVFVASGPLIEFYRTAIADRFGVIAFHVKTLADARAILGQYDAALRGLLHFPLNALTA